MKIYKSKRGQIILYISSKEIEKNNLKENVIIKIITKNHIFSYPEKMKLVDRGISKRHKAQLFHAILTIRKQIIDLVNDDLLNIEVKPYDKKRGQSSKPSS